MNGAAGNGGPPRLAHIVGPWKGEEVIAGGLFLRSAVSMSSDPILVARDGVFLFSQEHTLQEPPKHFKKFTRDFPAVARAYEEVGKAVQ